ncbi:MAG: hypothetical protein ACRERS_01310 [Methylococcales bacterium]
MLKSTFLVYATAIVMKTGSPARPKSVIPKLMTERSRRRASNFETGIFAAAHVEDIRKVFMTTCLPSNLAANTAPDLFSRRFNSTCEWYTCQDPTEVYR